MNSKLLMILLILIANNFIFCQPKSPFALQGTLTKHLEFKDSTRPSDKKVYEQCKKWELQDEGIKNVLLLVKPISSEQKGGLYYSLPCYYKGNVIYKNQKFTIEVNAASFITIYNEKTTLYFGCSSKDCSKYFVMEGGNASSEQ